MLERSEEWNRRIWSGHSHLLEDVTHALGGIGIGLLLAPASDGRGRVAGYALVAVSALLHGYAFVTAHPSPAEARWSR